MSTLKYEKSIVAFIDILGFKEIIKNSEKDLSQLQKIHSMLDFLKMREYKEFWGTYLVEIEEDAQKTGLELFDISEKIKCTVFSDSIVVTIKEEENINESFSTLVSQLAYISAQLMKFGILVRGGISYGNIIHDENDIIMGQGLIDAYEIESKLAKYPRIVLSDTMISKLNYPIHTKKNRYPYHQYLERFDDGCVGFHPLIFFEVFQNSDILTAENLKGDLKLVKETIIRGLDSSFQQPGVYEKYDWLKKAFDKIIILEENTKFNFHKLDEGIPTRKIHHSQTENLFNPENTSD